MAMGDLAVGVSFLSQTALGALGNFSLLCRHLLLHFAGCKATCTDLIVRHLTVANLLVLLSRGVPQTMAAFGLRQFSHDFRCSLLLFVQRVAGVLSMESTCLLSVFQAVTISPQSSRWAVLRERAPKYTVPSTSLCWVLNVLTNILFSPWTTGGWVDANITRDLGYCCAVIYHKRLTSLFAALLSLTDALSLGLTLWASGSMVSLLRRHKRQIRHIRTGSDPERPSAESRATQRILLLGSTFVFFHTLSFACQLCLTF